MDTKPTDVIKQQVLDRAKTAAELVFEGLVVKKDNAKLPETIFVDLFLPYFSGQKAITSDDSIMAKWISIAGTPLSEVDIIDNKGDVLYTVPPVFDTKSISVMNQSNNPSLTDIYNTGNAKKNNIPMVGDKFITNELMKKLETTLDKSQQNINNDGSWKDIFNRYGISNELTKNELGLNKNLQEDTDVVYD